MENVKTEVSEYISLKEDSKVISEKIDALAVVIMNDDDLRKDERITIVTKVSAKVIKESTYEKLSDLGEQINITETITRRKKFEEFDIDVQNALLQSEENFEESKKTEYIKIKPVKN